MGTKIRQRKTRAAEKRTLKETSLSKYGNGGKALATVGLTKPEGIIGVLRRIFKLAKGSDLTGQERINLVAELADRIRESGTIMTPQNFNLKNWRELAELFLKEFEEMDIAPKNFRAFISLARIKGYQGRVIGRLFHLYVRNFKPLQDDFLKWALDQIEELNNPNVLGTSKKLNLVNALGETISTPLKFNKLPFKAEKISIIKKDGKREEFIDDSFISFAGTGKESFMSFLTETEAKTVAAAKKGLSKQIASSQIRTSSTDTSLIVVEGQQSVIKGGRIVFEGDPIEVKVRPERVVYSPRSIKRSGVTLLSASRWAKIQEQGDIDLSEAALDPTKLYKASEFAFRSTTRGMGETYLFIRIALTTDELKKLVTALWPAMSKKK